MKIPCVYLSTLWVLERYRHLIPSFQQQQSHQSEPTCKFEIKPFDIHNIHYNL